MGSQSLNCPLCCNETFSSKQLLQEHLSSIAEKLYCPICNSKLTSLDQLIEHINQDDCQAGNTVHTILFEQSIHGDNIDNTTIIQNPDIKVFQNDINACDADIQFSTGQTYEAQVTNESNKLYVELFSKQLAKPCLETRELKLVKENGVSRYVIVAENDDTLNAESTIVTKQNTDGTISLTTVEDMKVETDASIVTEQTEPEDSQEGIYSCNTCNVSFSSVIEHIRNYHNDQDVVVQEPDDECESPEYEDLQGISDGKQTPRRVITDTGDIVEEPFLIKPSDGVLHDGIDIEEHPPQKVSNKQGHQVKARCYVKIDKLSDSVTKDVSKSDDSSAYHKVITQEVPTDSGFAVKMYHCMGCNISVTNLDEFKIHPCKRLKYPCPHCPEFFVTTKALRTHIIKEHKSREGVDENITYECGICSTVFPTNKSLKLHKRMHDPIKSRPIDPPVENTDGSEVSDGKYLCQVCDKMIPVDYRAIHQNSHKTSDKMNCAICNKKFTSIEYLNMHMNVHNIDKVQLNNQDQSLPYHCIFCNRRFARPHEKVKHERIHTGEKPHTCEICGKSFRVSYCLTLHMRTHTGARPYGCPHCGKRFKAHSVYNHHLLTHSEVRAYKCPFCPKAFKTSVQLAGHKNSHTKPFSCQQCNRPFASLYAVRVHTETHSRQNNLKFSCQQCGASYARAFALKDHIKQAHKEDQSPAPPSPQDDEWMKEENVDSNSIHGLNKDLQEDITELGMSANELIVP